MKPFREWYTERTGRNFPMRMQHDETRAWLDVLESVPAYMDELRKETEGAKNVGQAAGSAER